MNAVIMSFDPNEEQSVISEKAMKRSLVPRPRPAFHTNSDGKLGRAWE